MSSLDNLGSRHAEFSDSLLFRSGTNTVKKTGKIPPVKPTVPATNRGVSRQEDSEKQKGNARIWDGVEVVSMKPVFRPEIAFRESSKTPGVIELDLPAISDYPITLFGEKKRKKRILRRTNKTLSSEPKTEVLKKPSRHVSNVSDLSIRTQENIEERVYSDPDRKVPTYMFAFMSFVSFCIGAKHVDIMFGELPSAMGDPGVATEAERQLEMILMYEVVEEAALGSRYFESEQSLEPPTYQPSFYRGPEDLGPVGVGAIAVLAMAHVSQTNDDE